MRIFSVFIFIDDGRCLFNQSFTALAPPTSLITGLLTAVQSFVQEVTGANPEILSAGGFVFHMQKFGPLTVAITTSENTRPSELLAQIGIRFMQKYGYVETWKGKVSDFIEFENDLSEILGEISFSKRIDPINPLTSLTLMNLDSELQTVAQALIQIGGGFPTEICQVSQTKEYQTRKKLELLVEMGHIGRMPKDGDFYYYIQ